jgi:heme A synthase
MQLTYLQKVTGVLTITVKYAPSEALSNLLQSLCHVAVRSIYNALHTPRQQTDVRKQRTFLMPPRRVLRRILIAIITVGIVTQLYNKGQYYTTSKSVNMRLVFQLNREQDWKEGVIDVKYKQIPEAFCQ